MTLQPGELADHGGRPGRRHVRGGLRRAGGHQAVRRAARSAGPGRSGRDPGRAGRAAAAASGRHRSGPSPTPRCCASRTWPFATCSPAGRTRRSGIIRTVIGRLRAHGGTLRQREKLAGLGNAGGRPGARAEQPRGRHPALGARRSTRRSRRATSSIRPTPSRWPRPTGQVPARRRWPGPMPWTRSMELIGDAEEAAALVDAGWTSDQLRSAFAGMDPRRRATAAAWLAATATVETLIGEVRMAGDRISEIVGAVKSLRLPRPGAGAAHRRPQGPRRHAGHPAHEAEGRDRGDAATTRRTCPRSRPGARSSTRCGPT